MSLNKMIPLNGGPGNISGHKSKLQKCISVKYVICCLFLDAILNYTILAITQLAIENSFNKFLGHLNVGVDTTLVFLSVGVDTTLVFLS